MRTVQLIMALMFNLLLIIIEGVTFLKVKNKLNILKFYTFLQNFIALAGLSSKVCKFFFTPLSAA